MLLAENFIHLQALLILNLYRIQALCQPLVEDFRNLLVFAGLWASHP